MRRMNFLLAMMIACVTFSLGGCTKFSAKKDVKEANDLYKAKKYEEAIAKYEEALQKDPSLDTVYLNLGLSYMAMYVPGSTHEKDLEFAQKAITAFREYQKRNPDDEKVAEYLINMYLNSDRKEEAIEYFEGLLAEDNTDTATMQKLAFLYAQSGKFDEALKWYQRRAAVEPNNAEAYYIIGVICWEKAYKFIQITPEERERVVQIGLDALEKAIKINPEYADAYLYMNLLYREKAKLIALNPEEVPEDKIEEYNGYLEKAKGLQEKAMELRKKATS